SFRRRFDKNGGFNLNKVLVRKIVADLLRHLVAENKFVAHRIPADVQITVLHAEFLSPIRFIFNVKWWKFRGVKYSKFLNQYLHITGRNLWIFRSSLDNFT